MAQNVKIAGASYLNVPAIVVPKTYGGTAAFLDTSDATASASDILSGKTAYANGTKITGTGSQGVALNYALVGGTSQPSSPVENTIWVNTGTTITAHAFSALRPTSPVNGMVWIQTGTESPVAFDAVAGNPITVYPLQAQQYVGGAWVSRTAKSYMGGAWRNWFIFLYDEGIGDMSRIDNNEVIQPGSTAFPGHTSVLISRSVSLTSRNFFATNAPVDLTGINGIVAVGYNSAIYQNYNPVLAVSSTRTSAAFESSANKVAFGNPVGSVEAYLDVSSLHGSYYVGVGVGYNGYGIQVNASIWTIVMIS